MDRTKVKEISDDVKTALQAVATKHGLTVTVGGGVFTSGSFKPRVEFKTANADSAEWEQYARMFGLPTDAFGKMFSLSGVRYRIVGLKLNSRQMPVLVERLDGKQFKFRVAAVVAALASEAQP